MNEIRHNPFRYLGAFANATLKEIVAFETQLKAYARVGQRVDNPLRLRHLLGALPDDEESIRNAESLLTLEDERTHYAAFWFVQGPNPEEDLEAIRLLDRGSTSNALSIWTRRDDQEATQNLMVAYLVLKRWKQAVRAAQRLYHNEQDIHRFVTAVASGSTMKLRGMVRLSADNPQWDAVLKGMLVETCRKHIEQCLDDVDRDCNEDTLEALYVATSDFDDLRSVLGADDVVYLTLAERAANALSPKSLMRPITKQELNYLQRAYELAVEEQTKSRIVSWLVKNKKDDHFEIGCGVIGIVLFAIFSATGRTCSSSNNRTQPPIIPEYNKIEMPPIPPSYAIPTEIPDIIETLSTPIKLPKFSEEELEKLRELNKKCDNPMTDEEWERIKKELIKENDKP